MLFNSYIFMFVFLPVTFVIYFLLNKQKLVIVSKAWLVLASLFFYSWWNIKYLPIILASIIFNFSVGAVLNRLDDSSKEQLNILRKPVLIFGVLSNVALLGYFKYADFLISNVNQLMNTHTPLLHIILPLGISFFTFTQIAYLVDAYKGEVKEMDCLNYTLFVTFFPHLIAGPILHHKEMMPQFDSLKSKVLNYKSISLGVFLFCIGLFKKVFIADNLAVWASQGFDVSHYLSFIEAWLVSLSYTFQLYFDFSGYTDMALGIALMFNIRLPQNFNSPYKATNIQDFWRRWHITLSRFLREYIYIPLGGNRKGEYNTCQNLLITFLIGGLWHGASGTFVFWGFLHGVAIVTHRLWQKLNIKMHSALAWFITFNFVNIAWVFFRAKTWSDALKVLKGMFGLNAFIAPQISQMNVFFVNTLSGITWNCWALIFIAFSFIVLFFFKNSNSMTESFKPTLRSAVGIAIIAIIAVVNLNKISEFLYFQF